MDILAVGMVTPVGLTARASAAAARAGLARFRETELFDKNGTPFKASFIDDDLLAPLAPALQEDATVTPREERLLRLAGMALEECLDALSPDEPPSGVLVALPERRTPAVAGLDPVDAGRFVVRLAAQCGRPIDVAHSEARESGRAGALAALGRRCTSCRAARHGWWSWAASTL
jgi:3-oxoacyl-[acyl-carrier-protein] synthase-1